MNYSKPPLSYQQQIELFESRGLIVVDKNRARKYLEQISYYRLSAYALPFQNAKDKFNNGITFDHLLDLYLFDRELRLLIFDEIERIEVAIRAQIIYQLAHKYGSHWQDNASIFRPPYINRSGVIINIFSETQKVIE